MGFGDAVKSAMTTKYATFSGRASRSEFWYFFLFIFIGSLVAVVLDGVINAGFINIIFSIAIILPTIAVSVRRLHDQDKSGWWYLTYMIPIVGSILMIVFGCTRGTTGPNRFGDDPLMGAPENVFD